MQLKKLTLKAVKDIQAQLIIGSSRDLNESNSSLAAGSRTFAKLKLKYE